MREVVSEGDAFSFGCFGYENHRKSVKMFIALYLIVTESVFTDEANRANALQLSRSFVQR